MWTFSVPLLFSELYRGSLLLPSVLSFVSTLAVILTGSAVGYWIDKYNRLRVIRVSLVSQNASVIISFILLILIFRFYPADNDLPPTSAGFILLFITLNIFSASSAVASMTTSISIAKDWTIVLCKTHPAAEKRLSETNANVRRIDLFCKVFTPVVFSALLQFAGVYVSLIFVSAWNVCSFLPELMMYHLIYREVPQLAMPKGGLYEENVEDEEIPATNTAAVNPQLDVNSDEIQAPPPPAPPKRKPNQFLMIFKGWKLYFAQSVFLGSFAYVFLYLTVLSPGSLMTAYLGTRDVASIEVGVFQALASTFGITATFLTPWLISKFGLEITGLYSIWCQLVLIACAIPYFYFDINVWFFLVPIILSRAPLWSFDLIETQIMQLHVPEAERGVVNSVEYSLTNVFALMSYALGIIASDPEDYVYLVLTSVGSVACGAVLYSIWARKFLRRVQTITN